MSGRARPALKSNEQLHAQLSKFLAGEIFKKLSATIKYAATFLGVGFNESSSDASGKDQAGFPLAAFHL